MNSHKEYKIPPEGSAYPNKALRLANCWASRLESPGLKGWMVACGKSVHKWFTRVQVDKHRPDIRFLFMIGTMRSGSTLLSQILCSHRHIVGFGETHIQYDSDESFVELITRTMWDSHSWKLSSKYFFDKILHVELIEDISLLSHMPIDWIVLRRNGEDCVNSMVRTFGLEPDHAAAYLKRQWLAIEHWTTKLAGQENVNITTVEYDDLVNRPEETLSRLSRDLGLTPPLSRKYKIQRGLRKIGSGDPSGQVERGVIARIKHKEDLALSPEIIAELNIIDELSKGIIEKIELSNNRSQTPTALKKKNKKG